MEIVYGPSFEVVCSVGDAGGFADRLNMGAARLYSADPERGRPALVARGHAHLTDYSTHPPRHPAAARAYPEKINGQDQKAYILSVNNNRWHMSAGQRAMVPTCASSTWMCQQSMRSLYACG